MTAMSPADVHALYESAVNAGNLERLLALYESDATLVSDPHVEATGAEAIRASLQDVLALDGHVRVETLAVVQVGDLALLKSCWELEGTAPDGSHVALTSQGSEVVRRDPDKGWRFVIDHPWALTPVSAR